MNYGRLQRLAPQSQTKQQNTFDLTSLNAAAVQFNIEKDECGTAPLKKLSVSARTTNVRKTAPAAGDTLSSVPA